MYQRILLAYDGSKSGQQALLECRDVAQWGQATVSLVAVTPLYTVQLKIIVLVFSHHFL